MKESWSLIHNEHKPKLVHHYQERGYMLHFDVLQLNEAL